MEHPISELMGTTMGKIREMIDVNTIIGEPIHVGDTCTIIPVSKVSFGFGSGGSDFATKNQKPDSANCFGGGSGAGVNITPISFLIVSGDNVRLLPVTEPASNSLDRAIELIPELVEKVSTMLKEKKDTEF